MQNKVILERHLDIHGKEDIKVLEYAWINSVNQTGLKNLLDVAVLEYAQQYELVGKLQHFRKIDEIPFDFLRRRMSVVVRGAAAKATDHRRIGYRQYQSRTVLGGARWGPIFSLLA
jgi:magnesium-transporting ATPase (P-type)